MPVGQPTSSTPTYLGRILSCDPTKRLIDIQLSGGGSRVEVTTMPIAARWPVVGETWSVIFINNTPYLGEPYQAFNAGFTPIESVAAGDAFINSPTGVVHVLGGTSNTDFNFTAKNIPPPPPNTSGVYLAANGTGGSFWTGVSAGGGSSLVARAYRNGALSIPNLAFTIIPVDTASFDPSGIVNTSTGRITIPTAGYYMVTGNVGLNVSATGTYTEVAPLIFKNGVQVSALLTEPAVATYAGGGVTDLLYCNAGDYLQLAVYLGGQTATINSNSGWNYLHVVAISSLPGVTGTATAARAYLAAAQSIPSGAWTKINLDTVTFDPAGRFDVTTNHRYNVPASGTYLVAGCVQVTTTGILSSYVTVNGGTPGNDTYGIQGSGATNSGGGGAESIVTGLLNLNAGDYLQLWGYSSGPVSTNANAWWVNYLSVVQVGTSMNFTSAGGDLTGTYPNPTIAPRGRNSGQVNGAWSGSYGAVQSIPLQTLSITPVKPGGAPVAFSSTFSCFTTIAGSIIQGYYQIDGGAITGLGRFYFNNTSVHTQVHFEWITASLSVASHNITFGVYVAAGNVAFDSQDGGTFLIWELP